jgi:F-box/WD-40 domain protein MET30
MEKRQIQLRATGRGLNEWSPDITPLPESLPASREGSPDLHTGSKRSFNTGLPSPEIPNKRICARSQSADTYHHNLVRRPWKDVYKARFKVGTNWKYGRCSIKVLKGHTNGVVCLQFRDNILATGSYDASIKIWDIESGKEIRTLTGHGSGVRCLQFDDKQLASGSLDGTVRIWDWTTGELRKELRGPTRGVISVNFDGNFLCAGSMDTYIYVWNTLTKRTYRLGGHSDFVNSVKVDTASRTVFSASDDCTVRLWDLDTRRTIRVFDEHVGQVQQVLLLPPEFEVDESDLLDHNSHDQDTDTDYDHDDIDIGISSNPGAAATSHSNNPRQIPRIPTPPPPLSNTSLWPDDPSRPNPPQYILTAGLDSTIRLWHVPTARCLRTFFGHLEGIWALAADTLRVVSGAEDRMVKIWDPRTGKCERTFTGHTAPVTCVGLSGERLVSGGEDCEVRVLEFTDSGAVGADGAGAEK